MNKKDIIDILEEINFAPSNLDMGWDWDVKETKIYDEGIVLEKGFCIRTTFMRPDSKTGEIEKGYGRWMYIPENISKDGLVKTAWVCAELIVKHELMEAFLYQNKRIFDPHKSLTDLQYNSKEVENNVKKVTYQTHVAELKEPEVSFEGHTPSSSEIFHKQNSENHISEITEYLDENFKKEKIENSKAEKYIAEEYVIFNYKKDLLIQMAERSGKIINYRSGEKYNLSEVKELLEPIVKRNLLADPPVVNQLIIDSGFSDVRKKEDGDTIMWIYSHPGKKHRFIYHSEQDKAFAIVNNKGDILKSLEGDEYTIENIKKILPI
jgi:glycerophosphoryl diester phosphodiesterase